MYVVQLLNKAVGLDNWTLSTYDCTLARNHMLVILAVGNAHQTGVLRKTVGWIHENPKVIAVS